MSISVRALRFGVDDALFNLRLGYIATMQVNEIPANCVEIRILDGRADNLKSLLKTEAKRLDVPEPKFQSITDGIDLGGRLQINETAFVLKSMEMPSLLLLLDSGLKHRDQYTYLDQDEDYFA